MSPLTAYYVAKFRNGFHGKVMVAKDYEESAVVLAIPTACDANALRAFLEAFPPGGVRPSEMPWTPATLGTGPLLVHIDPATSAAATPQ